jgi:hypothetical protein
MFKYVSYFTHSNLLLLRCCVYIRIIVVEMSTYESTQSYRLDKFS